MENMKIYSQLCNTPKEAQKPIGAGRLKGFTDINPMWRIQRLTELFGPCGIGWWYDIIDRHTEDGADGEKKAFVTINLFYKYEGETSKPVQGVGGSSFVAKEKGGFYTNDECYKMALTDAIGTACKSLGMSADIYFAKSRTKYDMPEDDNKSKGKQNEQPQDPNVVVKQNDTYVKTIQEITGKDRRTIQMEALDRAGSTDVIKVNKALAQWLVELNQ